MICGLYDKLITRDYISAAPDLGTLRDILTLGDQCETVSMVDPVFGKMHEFLNSKTAWEVLSLAAEYEDMEIAVKAVRFLGATVGASGGVNEFFATRKLTMERFHYGLILAIGHDEYHKMNEMNGRQTWDDVADKYAEILKKTVPNDW